jgi:hypothetical protein
MQADAQNGYHGPEPSMELLTNKDGHVCGIEARQRLANGQHFDEFSVIDPLVLRHQASPQIRYDSAKTGGSDDQEFTEYVPDGGRHQPIGGL